MSKSRAILAAVAVSTAGLGLIAGFEGRRNSAYADPAHGWAVPTICYGHTLDVVPGQYKTNAECAALLKVDADDAAKHVLRLSKQPLTQGELDAYTSFVFNVGPNNFNNSTLLKKLNAGDRKGACLELLRWVHAGGRVYPGLVKRREAESTLCQSQLSPK